MFDGAEGASVTVSTFSTSSVLTVSFTVFSDMVFSSVSDCVVDE
jgi:hypothetical protein